MSQDSRFTKKPLKQTIGFLLAFAVTICAMLGVGVFHGSKAQDSLQKYGAISAVPMGKRSAAFSNASSKDKSDLFRTHLALYLARHPELDETQRQVILQGMSLATPQLYEIPRESPDWSAKVGEPMRQYESRIRAAFPRDEAARIFATFGGPETQDDPLQKYRTISLLPVSSRKTAFREASPEDKSNLWRTHLALYLARHPELNTDQSKIILEVMSLLTPALFDASSATRIQETRVRVRLLQDRMLALFSKDEGAKAFATLGDPEVLTVPSGAAVSILRRSANWRADSGRNVLISNQFVGISNPAAQGDCGCNCYDSDWCGSTSRCYCGACNASDWGCGALWLYPCNGHCGASYVD